eukprot:TRINITY_DN8430_c0_g1_i1.p1 TRINITY_DN8430_c0_g1~~TRINITY_DN8430_c0_g1_i1.p1  ORF type:complete len:1101 (+),score=344.95 TRINITY_DN8430_c0_g1_i1:393-3305(+)
MEEKKKEIVDIRPQPTSFEKDYKPIKFKNDNKLKDYQEESLRWLSKSWYNRNNVILADEMGLGKTVQALSFLQYLYTEQNVTGPFLVVAPLSTIEQWYRETLTWTTLDCLVYHGEKEDRKIMRKFMFMRKSRLIRFDLIITSYETVYNEDVLFQAVKWANIVIDEGHKLKNEKGKLFLSMSQITAFHKLILTGTPIQNNIGELWSLLNFLHPERFEEKKHFLEEYGSLKGNQVESLHKLLETYLLRRIKEEVEKNLPGKIETQILVELTLQQKIICKAILDNNAELLKSFTNKKKNSLMNLMMQVRKVCNHPYLIEGAEESILKESDNKEELFNMVRSSSKLILLDKLLKKLRGEGRRVLIFSQMTHMLDILEDYLYFMDYPCSRLDGSTKRLTRQKTIDTFSNVNIDTFVFLLSTRAGGLGINLQVADTIIIYDSDWNPQNDLQACARSHRIGQKNVVQIYRLLTKGTYEEYMIEVASKKLGLDHVVLTQQVSKEGESKKGAKLDPQKVEKLLKFGAYSLYEDEDKKGDKNLINEDIDSILKHRSIVVNHSNNKDNKIENKENNGNNTNNENNNNNNNDDKSDVDTSLPFGTFKKTNFSIENAPSISLEDENFWNKILIKNHTPETLLTMLKGADHSETFDSKNFMEGVGKVYQDLKEKHKNEFIYESIENQINTFAFILENVSNNKAFSSDQQEIAKDKLDMLKNSDLFGENYKPHLYNFHLNDNKNPPVKKTPPKPKPKKKKVVRSKSSHSFPKKKKTPCMYGISCYRKNPKHFEEYSHPARGSPPYNGNHPDPVSFEKFLENDDDDFNVNLSLSSLPIMQSHPNENPSNDIQEIMIDDEHVHQTNEDQSGVNNIKIDTFNNNGNDEENHLNLPICKYGSTCYRKNPMHVNQFYHPKSFSNKRKFGDEHQNKNNFSNQNLDIRENHVIPSNINNLPYSDNQPIIVDSPRKKRIKEIIENDSDDGSRN